MRVYKNILGLFCLCLLVLSMQSCQDASSGVDSTGSEYMPDMAHSIAYESNYYNYYYHNTWGTEDEYYEFAKPKYPVSGTVPRESMGANALVANRTEAQAKGMLMPRTGYKPYYYDDTEEGRAKATAELIDNPYPITTEGLKRGEELYVIFCGVCHGEKGDGNGYLVRDGSPYLAQPANFLIDEHLNASNGRYYHAIMHGKNLMGAYKGKMDYEERWQVIHWIRALQAKELKKEYSQEINTLNNIDVPAGKDYLAQAAAFDAEMEEVHEEHGEDGHSHDGDSGHDTDDHSGHDH